MKQIQHSFVWCFLHTQTRNTRYGSWFWKSLVEKSDL